MQCLVFILATPAEYLEEEIQKAIRPPFRCPHCNQARALRALGYYQRYISHAIRQVLLIFVRRFRCVACGKTVSMLPAFAQPYRVVRSETINVFVVKTHRMETVHWEETLRRYWRRFLKWLPELSRIIGSYYGLAPPITEPKAWWVFITHACGGLEKATMNLTRIFSVTLFGKYRCHSAVAPL